MALKQQIIGSWDSAFGNATTYINPLTGGKSSNGAGTLVQYTAIIPEPGGTIRNLRVTALNDLAGADDVAVFTLMKNGSDTGLTVTINDTTQSADNTSSVAYAATDTITFKRVTTGSPSGNTYFYSCEWEPTTADVSIYGWGNSNSNLAVNEFDGIFAGGQDWVGSSETVADVVAVPGSLTILTANLSVAPGAGTSRSFTVFVNGSTTAHVLTIADAATTGTLTFTQALVAGNRLSIKHTVSGAPAASRVSGVAAFTSSVADSWNFCGDLGAGVSGTSTVYCWPNGDLGTTVATATEADFLHRAPITSFQLSGMRCTADQAPGASKSWAVTLRQNSADTTQSVVIAGTDPIGPVSAGATVVIVSGDTFSLKHVPTNTPAATNGHRWVFAAGPVQIIGSAVFGVTTTVKATRAIAFGLDDATNVHDIAGEFRVFGDQHVTGNLTVDGTLTGSVVVADDSITNAKLANMAQSTLKGRAVGAGTGDPTDLTPDQASTILDTATDPFVRTSDLPGGVGGTHVIGITIDGGGSVITTGVKGFASSQWTGTITKARLLSTDASVTSGSIVIDVWKDSYSNYPPTVADTITASAKPMLSSATKSEDSTLTSWTTSVSAGDVFGFKVDSITSLIRVVLELTVEE